MLSPFKRAMPATDHEVVPVVDPLPPLLLDQLTCVTPTLSEAVPLMLSKGLLVECVVIDTTGGVVSGGAGGVPETVTLTDWLTLPALLEAVRV